MAGRPKKSEFEHQLHGTVSQSKPPAPSVFTGGRPKYPKHLSPAARSEFKRCVRLLEARGTVTEGDVATLAVYAELLARWIQCKAEIGRELMVETVVLDNNGMPHHQRKLNPLLKIAATCETRLLALAKSLGLTPIDRDKVKKTKDGATAEKYAEGSIGYMREHGQLDQPSNVIPITAAEMVEEEEKER